MSTPPTGGLLRYPYEAITQNTDYLQIRIFTYKRNETGGKVYTNGPNQSGQALDVSNYVSNKAKVLDPGGVIILPMPSNIQDSNVVSYDNDSMNAFAAMGVNAVTNIMGDVGTGLAQLASKTGSGKLDGTVPKDKDGKPGISPLETTTRDINLSLIHI